MQCVVCNTEFTGRKDKIYCSTKCGQWVRGRRYAERNPEKVKKKRLDEDSNAPRRIFWRVKSRAKSQGIPFNIDETDIVIPEVCPVLGLKLVLSNQGQGYHPDSPSLDKINPSKGYVKGNVRVISARANLLKNDATVEELERVLWDLKQLRNE